MSSESKETAILTIIFLLVLILYVVVGAWMEHKHLVFGHETGFIICFGMLISYIVYLINPAFTM